MAAELEDGEGGEASTARAEVNAMNQSEQVILCPVCGGRVQFLHDDKANHCEYCGSPVLGPSQSRDCVNHRGTLAKGACHICGRLVCEDCMEKRVGDYGGKLLTIVNCRNPQCIAQSEWAAPMNIEYQRLTNMEWADKVDNSILRVSGLGGVLMMVFELVMILSLLYIQYFTPWGLNRSNMPYFYFPGDALIVLEILGNFMSAMILQTALQTYLHERQLSSGLFLLGFLILEVVYLLFRGVYFNLQRAPIVYLAPLLLGAFVAASIMVFVGALAAMYVGAKKRKQIKAAKKQLGLT